MKQPCTIVCGPPGSGKTTYVKDRIQPGDLVLDRDDVCAALTWLPKHDKPQHMQPYVQVARNAIVERLSIDANRPRSWIITCGPTRRERDYLRLMLVAEVVMLAVEADECMRRLEADEAHANEARALIHDWWRRYEP